MNFQYPILIDNLLPIALNIKFRNTLNYREEDHDEQPLSELRTPLSIDPDGELLTAIRKKKADSLELGYYVQPTKEHALNEFSPFHGFSVALQIQDYAISYYTDLIESDFQAALNSYTQRPTFELSDDAREEDEKLFGEPQTFVKVFQFFSKSNPELLTIRLESVFSNGTLKMIFFSEYWILNETSFPLLLQLQEDKFVYDAINIEPSNQDGIATVVDTPTSLRQADHEFDFPEPSVHQHQHQRKFPKGTNTSTTLFDTARMKYSAGLIGIQSEGIVNNSAKIEDIERAFFCLSSSQFSQAYLDSLLTNKGMFLKLFTGNTQEDRKTLRLKIERLTDWSEKYSMRDYDTQSPYIEVQESLHSQAQKDQPRSLYELCMNVVQLPGKFNRTKLLVVAPKYLVMNGTDFPMTINQLPQSKELLAKLSAQSVMPLHWSFADKAKNLYVKMEKPGFRWSAPFEMEKTTSVTLKLKNMVDSENLIMNMQVPYIVITILSRLLDHQEPQCVCGVDYRDQPQATYEDREPHELQLQALPEPAQVRYSSPSVLLVSDNADIIKGYTTIPYAWEEVSKIRRLNVALTNLLLCLTLRQINMIDEQIGIIHLGVADLEVDKTLRLSTRENSQKEFNYKLESIPSIYVDVLEEEKVKVLPCSFFLRLNQAIDHQTASWY